MKMPICLLPILLVGCSKSVQVSPSEPAQVAPTPSRVLASIAEFSEPKKKVLSGTVTFAALSKGELSEIRIIPETGTRLIIPENQTYGQVDGFWWRENSKRWFKIPDHGEVWVGGKPKSFDGESELGDHKIYFRSQPFLAMANALRGGVTAPGWVANSGATRSPVAYPW